MCSGGENQSRVVGVDRTKFGAHATEFGVRLRQNRRAALTAQEHRRTSFSIVTPLCTVAMSVKNIAAGRSLCLVGEKTYSARRKETKIYTDQPRPGPISHVNKRSLSSFSKSLDPSPRDLLP